jgi:hypothetical protein
VVEFAREGGPTDEGDAHRVRLTLRILEPL